MKKFIKIIGFSALSLIFLVYLATAGFLWWSEATLEVEPVNDSIYYRSNDTHKIELIDDGLLSLKKRIELIDGAKNSIDLEFFIYEVDSASQIITQKLIAAADRGVRVRLLVDFSAPVFALKPSYAKKMGQANVSVKYYNTSNNLRIVSVQHRSHRKLLIIDETIAMTGGRNIGDDYFNLSTHYNFLDSDIVIEGPIVKTIRESFNLYWDSDYADKPLVAEEETIEVEGFFEKTGRIVQILAALATIEFNDSPIYKSGICQDIEFITDFPGVQLANRQVFRHLSQALKEATNQINGESPYFVLRPDGVELLESLSKKSIEQNYLTNSLKSTDAFYTVSALTNSIGDIRDAGVNLYVYNGSIPSNIKMTKLGTSKRWGIHSKRAVVDNRNFIIGTYNVDPRSANLNSEVLIICRDSPELAMHMSSSIRSRMSSAWPLIKDGESNYSLLITDADFSTVVKFVIALPLAELFKFLL